MSLLRIGHFYGSGDNNPTDGRHETFFQVLPTPRVYARFPFYDLMNDTDDFAQLWIRPHPRITLRTEFHNLRLSDSHDLWYLGGGAFQQGTFGYTGRPSSNHRALANIVDLSLIKPVPLQSLPPCCRGLLLRHRPGEQTRARSWMVR